MKEAKSYLKFSALSKIVFWDYYSLSNKNVILSKFPIVSLKEVVSQRKGFITIDDSLVYKRCRAQVQAKGIILRDEIIGKEIKTKKQQVCKTNDFLVAEIDAKVGGFGIIPDYLEDAIVSGHYFLFEIDKTKLIPEYLGIVIKQNDFFKQVKSTGSTNYAAIRPYHVLEYLIPLPLISEQERLINAYNQKVEQANQLEKDAADLDSEIEKYFLSQLGLKPFNLKERLYGLQTTSFAGLDRWDVFSTDNRIAIDLRNSKFELTSIGKSFLFAKRSFNKTKFEKESFKYIEIGAIDPAKGILEAKEVPINKAPSRATQIVKEGDLIIGTTRPYLKKFTIVSNEYDGDVCSSGFSIIAQSENYHLPYLDQFLKCSYGIEQLKNRMTGGLYPAITEGELKEIKIPLPEVGIQKQIMNLIEQKRNNILSNKENLVILKEQANTEFEKEIFGV